MARFGPADWRPIERTREEDCPHLRDGVTGGCACTPGPEAISREEASQIARDIYLEGPVLHVDGDWLARPDD